MTNYAVSYTVGDGEPQENADGEEYIPEHAVPIVDGVAVTEAPALAEDEDAAGCSETTKAGEPCKAPPGEDGLCSAHRRQKEAGDADPGAVETAVDPDQAAEEAADGEAEGGQVSGS